MRIVVKFSFSYKDIVGKGRVNLNLAKDSTVREALEVLIKKFPKLKEDLPYTFVAVNEEYAKDDVKLKEGDEIELLPAVGGG